MRGVRTRYFLVCLAPFLKKEMIKFIKDGL